MSTHGRVAIVIASVGRPVELARWVDHVRLQTLAPVEMIWSVVGDADLPSNPIADPAIPLRIIRAPRGLPAQRNAALDRLHPDADIVAFFDDDYLPSRWCVEGIAKGFSAMPNVVGMSGRLLADGINSSGISYTEARALVDHHDVTASSDDDITFRDLEGLYGCNMAYRVAAIADVRFDERLPLYGWQEDFDFAARMRKGNRIGGTNAFVGVHQGVKGGRTSGYRLGYSQIANPLYLYRKGSMRAGTAARLLLRNMAANHLKMFHPEAWVDRRGRAVGNWLALRDASMGKMRPERILDL